MCHSLADLHRSMVTPLVTADVEDAPTATATVLDFPGAAAPRDTTLDAPDVYWESSLDELDGFFESAFNQADPGNDPDSED